MPNSNDEAAAEVDRIEDNNDKRADEFRAFFDENDVAEYLKIRFEKVNGASSLVTKTAWNADVESFRKQSSQASYNLTSSSAELFRVGDAKARIAVYFSKPVAGFWREQFITGPVKSYSTLGLWRAVEEGVTTFGRLACCESFLFHLGESYKPFLSHVVAP